MIQRFSPPDLYTPVPRYIAVIAGPTTPPHQSIWCICFYYQNRRHTPRPRIIQSLLSLDISVGPPLNPLVLRLMLPPSRRRFSLDLPFTSAPSRRPTQRTTLLTRCSPLPSLLGVRGVHSCCSCLLPTPVRSRLLYFPIVPNTHQAFGIENRRGHTPLSSYDARPAHPDGNLMSLPDSLAPLSLPN